MFTFAPGFVLYKGQNWYISVPFKGQKQNFSVPCKGQNIYNNKKMNTLFQRHNIYLSNVPMTYVRNIMEKINWESRLIIVKGPKGVGKSTLLKQYIKLHFDEDDRHVLYCSADTSYFSNHTLVDTLEKFYQLGGRFIFIDEIHKYPQWSKEIKEIYDLYTDLHIVLSGSSLIQINDGEGDLSRRIIPYNMSGLSLREYILFEKGIELPSVTLEDLLDKPSSFCSVIRKSCSPLEHLKNYFRCGYYPFFFNDKKEYEIKVEGMMEHIVDNELVRFRGVDIGNTRKIKALLHIISEMTPYEVDITKLSKAIGIKRETILKYLSYLDEAKLTIRLFSKLETITELQKPDKLYLDNPNLLYTLSSERPLIGTVRETFFANQLQAAGYKIEYAGYKSGDFRINNKYIVEIGGADKGFSQVKDAENGYVAADDIESAVFNKIPLWAFGFLY